jgi:hypothetical protein
LPPFVFFTNGFVIIGLLVKNTNKGGIEHQADIITKPV